QVPPGPLHADLGRGPAFVRAVVPLQQVGLGPGLGTEPGQLARPASPPERADENAVERLSLEPYAQAPGIGFPARGQREIGPTRGLVRDRPRRLAVPRQVHSREQFAHEITLTRKAIIVSSPFSRSLVARTPSPSVARPVLQRRARTARRCSASERPCGSSPR